MYFSCLLPVLQSLSSSSSSSSYRFSHLIFLQTSSSFLPLPSLPPPGLTSPLLLHATLTFLLSPPGLLHLLVLPTLVEVLHHDAHEHVEDEEADDQEEGDEVEQHPRAVVDQRLEGEEERVGSEEEGEENK